MDRFWEVLDSHRIDAWFSHFPEGVASRYISGRQRINNLLHLFDLSCLLFSLISAPCIKATVVYG